MGVHGKCTCTWLNSGLIKALGRLWFPLKLQTARFNLVQDRYIKQTVIRKYSLISSSALAEKDKHAFHHMGSVTKGAATLEDLPAGKSSTAL